MKNIHRIKKSPSVSAIAAAIALGLSFGGNAALAQGVVAQGAACSAANGQAGTIDATGLCVASSAGKMETKSIGIMGGSFTGNGAGITITPDGGSAASATNLADIAIGSGATANNVSGSTAVKAIAMGASANATGNGAIAIGDTSHVQSNYAIALGANATVTADNSVALGTNSSASRANVVAVGSTTAQRQVVNMAAGVEDTDAVNVSQLKPVVTALGGGASIDPTTGAVTGPTYNLANGGAQTTVGGALSALDGALTTANTNITNNTTNIGKLQDQLDNSGVGLVMQDPTSGNITVGAGKGGTSVDFSGSNGPRVLTGIANGVQDTDAVSIAQMKAMGLYDPNTNLPMAAVVYDGIDLSSVTFGGSNGTTLNNVAPGLIASGSMQAINGGQLFDVQQGWQSQFDQLSSYYNSLDGRVTNIEQGNGGGNGGSGDFAGTGKDSTQVGQGAAASGDSSTATGADAVASGTGSTATGANSRASGNGSTAVGQGAQATGENSTALGSNSSATGNGSVALGSGSVADRDNSVSVGSAGNERQITNVAAGTQRTDAANWGQVQDAVSGVQNWADAKFQQMNTRIDRQGAMSAAWGQMAFSAQGLEQKNRVAVGVGMQNGQSALAVGYSRSIKPNLNVTFGGSASASDVSVGAGMSFGW